ncbi:MAG: hypothetical protein LBF15_00675 [Candidatus Peribacteria bacterium]|nr:hypothetical protein [Candidatus Peribacteria bacterium]
MILEALVLIKDRNNRMDLTRWIGLFMYFSSITTIIGFFTVNYYAYFNFYLYLEPLL